MVQRPERPLVIAHRGASAYRPENTASAYRLAIEQGADMIEVDLHRSRDGGIVIAHDADLARLGGRGEIGEHSLAEIRCLDAGDSQPIPTLDEVLDGYASSLPFNLELKRAECGEYYEGMVERALAAVSERALLDETIFSSFYDVMLLRLRGLSPEARLATLVSPADPDGAIDRALAAKSEAVNPHLALATDSFVARAHEAGLAVYVYTVDDEDLMRRLLAIGVDGLFTNRPDRMRAVLDRR